MPPQAQAKHPRLTSLDMGIWDNWKHALEVDLVMDSAEMIISVVKGRAEDVPESSPSSVGSSRLITLVPPRFESSIETLKSITREASSPSMEPPGP